jgi:aerobic carbon-monoxide dehydrogenase large subunit
MNSPRDNSRDRRPFTGQSVRRTRDDAVLRGQDTYTADVKLPRMAYAVVFRSPYAHARITRLDFSRALAYPGVILAVSGASLPEFVRPISGTPQPAPQSVPSETANPRVKVFPHWCLAKDTVRFVGEPVAALVAEDPYVAEDALELIDAEFDALPVVASAEEAIKQQSPLLYEAWEDNVQLRYTVTGGDVERAFAEADLIVRDVVRSSRYTGTPIEPRVVIARYSERDRSLEVWDTTQQSSIASLVIRNALALPDLNVRVITLRVGGGFGQKRGYYSEEVLVPLLAMLAGRPVKWVETRSEHMVGTCHARDQVHHLEAAVMRDGRIVGLRDRILVDMGVAHSNQGVPSAVVTALYIPGAYHIENFSAELLGLVTNKTVYGPHRGFGKADSAYAIERFMDSIAAALNIDAAEIRRRNLIPDTAFPYVTVTGTRFDSAAFQRAFEDALSRAGYDGWRKKQEGARRDGRYIGVGTSIVIDPSSASKDGGYTPGHFGVRIQMDPLGSVTVFSSGNDEGQGHGAVIAQLVADELGITPETVRTVEGDSALCPVGSGSYSARFSVLGTSAVTIATRQLRDKLMRIGANALGISPEAAVASHGRVTERGTDRHVTYATIARMAYFELLKLPDGMEPGLEVLYYYLDPNLRNRGVPLAPDSQGRFAPYSSVSYAASVAVVEVDVQTGRVTILDYVSTDDSGKLINPVEAEGQFYGAFAHGVGGALYEELVYDEQCQLLTQNFKDYLVPTALEVPPVRLGHLETPNPYTPGGFKGASETGAAAPPPTLANAVQDALRPLGVRIARIPLTPSAIWEAIRAAQAGAHGRPVS